MKDKKKHIEAIMNEILVRYDIKDTLDIYNAVLAEGWGDSVANLVTWSYHEYIYGDRS